MEELDTTLQYIRKCERDRSEFTLKSQQIQIATFLNIIGQEGIDIYNSFDDNEIEELIDGKTKNKRQRKP